MSVLVTGAFGFLGRYVVTELLEQKIYDQVIALDILKSEYDASPSSVVLSVQMDLIKLMDQGSIEYSAFRKILGNVTTVIHLAAIVETRENERTKKLVKVVNTDVATRIAELSNEMGVKRFIFVSSAAAACSKLPDPIVNKSVPSYLRVFCMDSLFSNRTMSTYGESKLQAEVNILQLAHENQMVVCALRPHVVWGRGDPLATETMISWPRWLPHILVGDPNLKNVFIRVDNVAKYIVLADAALCRNPRQVSGFMKYHSVLLVSGIVYNTKNN